MKITIKKEIHQLPTSWKQLRPDQQKFIVKVLKMDSGKSLQPHELLPAKRMLLVQNLLNLDIHFMREWERDCICQHGQMGQLIFQSELHEILISAGFLFEKAYLKYGMEKYKLKKRLRRKNKGLE